MNIKLSQVKTVLTPKTKAKREKTKPKTFRISAKRVFLTYSQVPEALTKESVLQQLQAKLKIHFYIVAEERHEDGGKHFHVLLQSNTKFNIRNPALLDIRSEGEHYHGNYQEARRYKSVASYITKDNSYITNYCNFIDGDFISVEEDIIRIAPEMGARQAAQYFLRNYPERALKGMTIRNAESFVNAINKTGKSEAVKTAAPFPFKMNDFNLPDKLQSWVQQGCQPTLLLVGDGGTNKTTFCKTLANDMGWNLLICNHTEALKGLTEEHDAVLFDDITLTGLDEQQLLALIATDEIKQIRVLHGTVDKPAGLFQMITLNTNVLKKIKNKLMHKQYLRRLQFVLLDKPMVMNLNVNVQINNHTQIYNNQATIEDNERLLNSL